MTPEQASKIICQRYDLDLSDYEMKKMQGIIRSVATIKKKVTIKPTKVNQITDINAELKTICSIYDTTPEEVKSKKRNYNLVRCRVHFVRHLYLNRYPISLPELGRFLNRHHSSIIFLRDKSKAEVAIPPFKA